MPNQFGLKTIAEMEKEINSAGCEAVEYVQQPVVIPWRKITVNALRVLVSITLIYLAYLTAPWFIAVLHVMAPVNDHEPFYTEADGIRHSLEGYINNLQYTAPEYVADTDSVVVRNGRIDEQTLNLYKDEDHEGYCDGQYTTLLTGIKEWAFMTKGHYLIVSQPNDTTQAPDSCLVSVNKKGVDQVDSE